jgi:hypothetical protein
MRVLRVHAQNIRRGDVLLEQLSVRVPQTAKHFKSDSKHVWVNLMKFDPTELVKIERHYDNTSQIPQA